MARLGDYVKIRTGYAFKSELFTNNGVPVIRIGNLTSEGMVVDENICFDESFWENNPNYRINKNDILIAMSGATVGKCCINNIDGKFLLNQRVAAISCEDYEISRYIYHVLNSEQFKNYVAKNSEGCAQPNISSKQLADFSIKIDENYDLKNIVLIFDIIDKLNICKKHQLSKLEELVKSRFIEMFGNIHEPSKWDKKPWSELVIIQNGRDYKKILVESGGYPVYGTGGEMARASEYLCPENTIIVGRKGTINNPLLVKEKFWNVDTAFGVIVGNQLHYQYFYNFCRMFDFSTLNKQAVLPSTTKADLLKIQIAVPPMELQNQFATFVEQTDKSKLAIQQSLEQLETLKKSLMQQYFG